MLALKLAIWRAETGVTSDDVTRGEQLALDAPKDAVQVAALGDLHGPD